MGWLNESAADLRRLKTDYDINFLLAILANRGFHALFIYRLSHWLNKVHVPLIPLLLTRIIQILYSIDIDYKSEIKGGVIIVHGVGLVVGHGAVIKTGVTLYHGVTLGRKTQGKAVPVGDGFPTIEEDCVIGAGAKLLGLITVGRGAIVGPNCVLTRNIEPNNLIKITEQSYNTKVLNQDYCAIVKK